MNDSSTGGALLPTNSTLTGDARDDVLQALIVSITGLDGSLVRPRWQPNPPKQPAPDVDWCAIGITDDEPGASVAIIHDPTADDGQGADIMIRHRNLSVLASFYGPNSAAYAEQAQDGLALPQNIEILQSQLMTYSNTDTIRQVPELINQQWVKRFDVPLHFRQQVRRTYAVRSLVSANVGVIPE